MMLPAFRGPSGNRGSQQDGENQKLFDQTHDAKTGENRRLETTQADAFPKTEAGCWVVVKYFTSCFSKLN
jgi:hypothetical protein